MCYFCLNDMTNGIHHRKGTVVYVQSDEKKVKTSGCTDEQVNILGKSSSYCHQCYPMQPSGMKSDLKKENANKPLWGVFFVMNPSVRNSGMILGMISTNLDLFVTTYH